MTSTSLRIVLLVLLTTGLLACSPVGELPDPKTLPYRFEKVRTYRYKAVFEDLDGDGRDEVVTISPGMEGGDGGVLLFTQEGVVKDQANFAVPIQEKLVFLDVKRDGLRLIVVPWIRNDSLFVSFVDNQGQKLEHTIFITIGKPRRLEEGLKEWDPRISGAWLVDVNDDGREELVTLVNTYYAGLPRGLFVHTWPEGVLLDTLIVGAKIGRYHYGDFDGDGQPEIVFGSNAADNGAVAGGMDDMHSYVGVFDLSLPLQVRWHQEMGGVFTMTRPYVGDVDGDGAVEVLAFTKTQAARPDPLPLRLFDVRTGTFIRQVTLEEQIRGLDLVDLDRDGTEEILALGVSGYLYVLNSRLGQVRRRLVAEGALSLDTRPDLDGDGVKEIVVYMLHGWLLLDPTLRPKALAEDMQPDGVVRRGAGLLPYVYHVDQDGLTHVFRLVKNPYWFVYRYGPWLLWILGVGLALLMCGVVVSYYRRGRQLGKAVRLHTERSLDQERKTQSLADSLEREVTGIQHTLQSMQRVYREHASEVADQLDEHSVALEDRLKNILRQVQRFGKGQPVEPTAGANHSADLAFLEKVKGVVEKYLSDSALSVTRLADEIGYSERQLQRKMKEVSGCTPRDFIMQIRLAHAARLLEEEDSQIKQVAFGVGFRNPDHFSVKFREAYGISPSEYKGERNGA